MLFQRSYNNKKNLKKKICNYKANIYFNQRKKKIVLDYNFLYYLINTETQWGRLALKLKILKYS